MYLCTVLKVTKQLTIKMMATHFICRPSKPKNVIKYWIVREKQNWYNESGGISAAAAKN